MLNLNGIKVKNPFFISAGPIKYGRGYEFKENPLNYLLFKLGIIKLAIWGGIITKTFTLDKNEGNYKWYLPWKVLRKIKGGWVNRFGWNNCGLKVFISDIYPNLNLDNLIISIGALKSTDELLEMVKLLNQIKLLAIEINISCPHVEILFRNNLDLLRTFLVNAVAISRHPLILKLGVDDNTLDKAVIAEKCGINALSLINTVETYISGFGVCGQSGRIIKPIALKTINRVSKVVNIPIIGIGGINNVTDCSEFIKAGASAVGMASIFFNPFKAFSLVSYIKHINSQPKLSPR